MPLTRSRFFLPCVFFAYVAFAAIVAGAAAPVAGMVLLVVGAMVVLGIEHLRWRTEEAGRTTLARPFRPDPYGLADDRPGETDPVASAPAPAAPDGRGPAS